MNKPVKDEERVEALLRELVVATNNATIVQLGLAGVPQQKIREIVGGDIGRVNRIVRHLKSPKKQIESVIAEGSRQ
jgi:hypothetical protein